MPACTHLVMFIKTIISRKEIKWFSGGRQCSAVLCEPMENVSKLSNAMLCRGVEWWHCRRARHEPASPPVRENTAWILENHAEGGRNWMNDRITRIGQSIRNNTTMVRILQLKHVHTTPWWTDEKKNPLLFTSSIKPFATLIRYCIIYCISKQQIYHVCFT